MARKNNVSDPSYTATGSKCQSALQIFIWNVCVRITFIKKNFFLITTASVLKRFVSHKNDIFIHEKFAEFTYMHKPMLPVCTQPDTSQIITDITFLHRPPAHHDEMCTFYMAHFYAHKLHFSFKSTFNFTPTNYTFFRRFYLRGHHHNFCAASMLRKAVRFT